LKLREEYEPYAVRVPSAPPTTRPRVLHFIGNFHTGGSARLIVDLVEQLGHRFEQSVVVRSLPPRLAYTGIDLVHRERFGGARPVLSLLERLRPDLVHVHLLGHHQDAYGQQDWRWYHRVFEALEAYGRPVVENLNIPVEPYVSDAVRCYVHVSDHVRERFGRLDARNETIHPGSDLSFFSRRDDEPIPDDVIGMVYRLQPDKLDEYSIEPFIEAVRRRPGTRALVVGGGQYLEAYRRRVSQAGVQDAFTFTGYVSYDELPRYMARMSVFVAPVHTESFGQVSPFAMGMGIPVVGYRVGALEEILGSDELLAPPGDAAGLARIALDLLDDRERRLRIGEANRRRAEERFSVESMARRYGELYDELLRSPGSRRRVGTPPRGEWNGPAGGGATPPTVSVVMAAYDAERFLREAIESILDQTYRDFELLVVDDGSADGTREIVRSYEDPRIRLVENGRNLGLARSLNRGIALARGRYLARLDADDVAEPERLARQVAFLDRRPEVGLLGSRFVQIDEAGRETARCWVPTDGTEIRWTLLFLNAFAHSAVMIRRSALERVGGYDEGLVYAMDYDLWCRIAERMPVANLEECLLRWRSGSTSMTATYGVRTEGHAMAAARVAGLLGWPPGETRENERRFERLAALAVGTPQDLTPAEVAWAIPELDRLLERFCSAAGLAPAAAASLRSILPRRVARHLLWMGHRYPDARDHRSARAMLAATARVHRASLLTANGAGLALKLLFGPALVRTVRLTRRSPTG
jgi:glycosyltransferase involved in cell wall biosynthesis